jgi:cell division protease FtsH
MAKESKNAGKTGSEERRRLSGSQVPHWGAMALWVLIICTAIYFAMHLGNWMNAVEIPYSEFLRQLDQGKVAEVRIEGQSIRGQFRQPTDVIDSEGRHRSRVQAFRSYLLPFDQDPDLRDRLLARDVRIVAAPQKPSLWGLVSFWLPTLLLIGFFIWMMRRARDVDGTLISSFIKSPAKRYERSNVRVTFNDVADMEHAKQELQEIVEFLRNPERFQRLGGQIPKGVLLVGPPGTGKTLLARAVAGEAGVPFFSISGSEFIQMFVGVGASRVRDLFKTAKENAPSIIFIDEIDAVGRARGTGLGGGHDEREQTLNQILSEMDGFAPNESVIVIAATNRPDVLDPALLRPGRFDRHITVDRPTQKGRLEILQVHTRTVPLADDVDLEALARATAGLTGADLRNLVNEAALLATREGKEKVDWDAFEKARDKILMGPKREEILSDEEKRITAYHEAGHALVAWLLNELDPLHKVTIIPRGRALGVTQLLPVEDRHNLTESQIRARLAFMLAGRAAERMVFRELSAGAEDDLRRATQLARYMVTHWGMSERLGPVSYRVGEEHVFLGKEIVEPRDFSEYTARLIDEEVQRILREADQRALHLLSEHRDRLDRLAQALLQHEELSREEIDRLFSNGDGQPPRRSPSELDARTCAPLQALDAEASEPTA